MRWSKLAKTELSNQPRENSRLEVCHVVAYTTVKQKQMVGFYFSCALLRLYYTIYVFYVSFYKNKNHLYKYEAMLVIFGGSLIYRDKLSICWEENDSVMKVRFLEEKRESIVKIRGKTSTLMSLTSVL